MNNLTVVFSSREVNPEFIKLVEHTSGIKKINLNEIYKIDKDQSIMDLMKRLTTIKRKVESRLNTRIVV